ncbi:MAG TPA: hypothetical protein VHH52_02290 [Pseudonocardiaceae bacterium]|nr:hypothetical protein [Pseudonocardiaceae bacterium]
MPISTIDLFGDSFALLTGSRGQHWRQAGGEVSHRLGIRLDTYQIGTEDVVDPMARWTTHYRATDSDAVLVHPDRFIAWRSAEHSNPQELEAALRHVLDR